MVANKAPPLQPTTRSTRMPDSASTCATPMAAAHLTLPEPMTSVTLGRTSYMLDTVAISGTRLEAGHGSRGVVKQLDDAGKARQ